MKQMITKLAFYAFSIWWNKMFGLNHRRAKVAKAVTKLRKFSDHMYERGDFIADAIVKLEERKGAVKKQALEASDYAHRLAAAALGVTPEPPIN
jgi:hypothetical protein